MWSSFMEKTGQDKISFGFALVSWFLVILGAYIFVLDKINSYADCIIWGSLYALIIYGVFNATNLAILSKTYSLDMAYTDVLSGMTSVSVSLLLFYYIYS